MFTCLTIFREPVSRIQSCWNFRFVQNNGGGGIHWSNLASTPAEDMAAKLTQARSQYGEGCLNEPMRIFSDFGDDEELVNNLTDADNDFGVAELALEQTIERAGRCVVGVLERCADTKATVAKHLPFLAPFFSCENHHNAGEVEKGDLSDDQMKVLLDLSLYEQRAYEKANLMLDAQMA